MERWKNLFIVVAICFVGTFVKMTIFPSATFRYRLQINAIDAGRSISKASVFAVNYSKNSSLVGGRSSVEVQLHGEAIFIELSNGGAVVFPLLPGGEIKSDPKSVLAALYNVSPWDLLQQSILGNLMVGGKRDVPPSYLPLTTILASRNSPGTARYVPVHGYPEKVFDEVLITGATIEVIDNGIWPLSRLGYTGSQPTSQIASVLPWTATRQSRDIFLKAIIASGWQSGYGAVDLEQLFSSP